MDDNTAKLIRDLAEKLGTTGEHLWGVLVKQAPVSCATQLAVFAAESVALVIATRFLLALPKLGEFDDEMPLYLWRGGLWLALIVSWFGFFCALEGIGTTLAGFTNPEFWAFKQIVK